MNEVLQEQSNGAATKNPRFRSVAYPSNTISHCVELTSTLYKLFGNIYATRENICKQLDISDSHVQTQLSSCVQYGLLDLKPKEGYKPTTLFTKIYKPLPSEKKEDSLLEAFKKPELYKNIIKEYNNQPLTPNGLSIILFRNHKISENASQLAAKIFLDNATSLGLLGAYSVFNVETTPVLTTEEIDTIEEKNTPNHKDEPEVIYLPPSNNGNNSNATNAKPKTYDTPPIPIFVTQGVAELYLPNGFNKEDIERVIKVLKAYIE